MAIWKKWIPIEGIPSILYIDKILNNFDGLFITLKSDINKKRVIFAFKDVRISLRCSKREILQKTIDDLERKYGPGFCTEWSLFTVEGSNYAHWLEDESYGFYEAANLNNFVFIGTNKVFEVLAGYEPEVVIEEIS